MNKTRISAILLTVVMLVSMLSCMVLPAAAEMGSGLGSPVAIEEVAQGVGGAKLPTNIKVVNDDWFEKTGYVYIKLDGQVYRVVMGQQAFAELADAVSAAKSTDVIYVAPGNYTAAVTFMKSNIKVFGPNAGVSPNAANMVDPNPARPGASAVNSAPGTDLLANEAVLRKPINVAYSMIGLTFDGLYFADTFAFVNTGNQQYRNGLYFRNNIINAPVANVFQLTTNGRAWSSDVVIEGNRVLSGTNLVQNGAAINTKILNNYINIGGQVVLLNSASNGSIGDSVLIDGNYINSAAGLLQFTADLTSYNAQTVLFGVTVSNNVVADAPAGPLVNFKFDGQWTLPGTNVNIIGNTIKGVDDGVTPFVFYYKTFFGNAVTFRHIININENYVDLPVGTPLVSSDVNGVLNVSKNYYTNGITADQIVVDKEISDTDIVLYPYYTNPEMTETAGDCRIESVAAGYNGVIDQTAHTVTMNVTGKNLDVLDLTQILTASAGCTGKVFSDKTLNTVVDPTAAYLDGAETHLYVLLSPAGDDGVGTLYEVTILREVGTKAQLLDIVFDRVMGAPAVNGTNWTYAVDTNQLFVNYDMKVSAGATYTLYADSACTKELEDTNGYIPYGGYTVYVKVVSEDAKATATYAVVFNRNASSLDPTVITADCDKGDVVVRNDVNKLYSYLTGFVSEVTYDLTTTAGSTYRILKGTTEVSSSANVRAIALVGGTNNFTVEVKDAKGKTNVIALVVENGIPSSDATITNVPEHSAGIADGVIAFTNGNNPVNFSFTTRNAFATCQVFADATKKIELTYSSNKITDPETGKTIENRSFSAPNAHKTNVYYVVCTAEDGVTKKEYKLVISKNLLPTTYADITDLNAWYADYVLEATEKGLMEGSKNEAGENIYRPGDQVTRQEMAVIVSRLMGVNGACYADVAIPYADAASIPEWAAGYVKACYFNGYIQGAAVNGVSYYQPQKNITREEVMAIFARLYNLTGSADLSGYTDVNSVSPWALNAVKAVVESGLIEGSDNKLMPKANITRAEIATIVVCASKL